MNQYFHSRCEEGGEIDVYAIKAGTHTNLTLCYGDKIPPVDILDRINLTDYDGFANTSLDKRYFDRQYWDGEVRAYATWDINYLCKLDYAKRFCINESKGAVSLSQDWSAFECEDWSREEGSHQDTFYFSEEEEEDCRLQYKGEN